MKTPKVIPLACLAFFLLITSGCANWEAWDARLQGVHADEVTWKRNGFLGSATVRANDYTNGSEIATAERLFIDENLPLGAGSATLDIKGWKRAKTPVTNAELTAKPLPPVATPREPETSPDTDEEG